jgi:signal transduction histidine kinase
LLRTVYGKLSAVVLLLFYAVGIVSITLTILSNRLYYQEMSQGVSRALAKRLVSKKDLMPGGVVDRSGFGELSAELESINPSVNLYLLDLRGEILTSSVPEEELALKRVSLEPLRRMMAGGMLPIFGDNPRYPEEMSIFSVCPVPVEGEADAYLYAVIGGGQGGAAGTFLDGSNIVRLSLLTFFGGLILFSLVALFVFRFLTRRVRRLAQAVEEFERQGFVEGRDFPGADGSEGGDEIDRLGESFAGMAERIGSQLETIRREDALRRELITNVSHDLRTPLTSLQGYLETLKIKENISEAERQEYLETALRQSERLRRLVFELFELAKLDSGEVQPSREPFAPGELVQDVVQKYQINAERQGIDLTADLEGDIPVISADIGLLERALENLLRNALQFTLPGGSISVKLSAGEGEVFMEVRDTGIGIAPGEIPRIFERSFRQRPPAGKADEGAGLGLSITRRIAELHGGRVTVASTPGSGSTFTLAVPVDPAPGCYVIVSFA